jgi:hypothetical protein
MAKAKLELDAKKPQDVLATSISHITAMATPEPSVADFLVSHNALSAAINLITSLEGQLSAARAALPVVTQAHMDLLRDRATYVEDVSNGDPAIIPISGFAVACTQTYIIEMREHVDGQPWCRSS